MIFDYEVHLMNYQWSKNNNMKSKNYHEKKKKNC